MHGSDVPVPAKVFTEGAGLVMVLHLEQCVVDNALACIVYTL